MGREREEIEYTTYPWGPLLFKSRVKLEDIKELKKICNAATENFSSNLAGIIKDERVIDKFEYLNIIKPYFKAYQKAYQNWYGVNLEGIKVNHAWVNFMKKGESNPPHVHNGCDLSSVLFIDIPDEIKKEQREWKGTGSGPGSLMFITGNPQPFHTHSFEFKPEIGDFFIFPWNLTHSVANFRSDVTRISVAANFSLLESQPGEKK